MTATWQHLDADQHAAIACIITCFVGLCIAAASVTRSVRQNRQYRDAQQRAERDAAEDAYLIAYAEAIDAIDFSNAVWAELDREAS